MREINEAYHILSDSTSRTEYHKKWLANFTNRSSFVSSMSFSNRGIVSASPKDILDQFFMQCSLKTGKMRIHALL